MSPRRDVDPLELTRPADRGWIAPHSAERQRQEAREIRAAEAVIAARERGLIGWLLEGPGWALLRPFLDAIALAVAVLVTLAWPDANSPTGPTTAFLLFPPVVMALLSARGMYAQRLRVSILDGVAPVVGAVSLGVIMLVAAEVYLFRVSPDTAVVVHLWAVSLLGLAVGRVGAATAQRVARGRTITGRPALIVGAGVVGGKVARRLQDNPEYGLRPIGFLDGDPPGEGQIAGLPVLGGHDDIEWIASLAGAEHVVLAFSRYSDRELVAFAQRCIDLDLEVSVVPRLFEAVNDKLSYEAIGGLPLMALRPTRPRGSAFAVKHAVDVVLAAAALTVLAPLLLTIAAVVKLDSPGPVFFRQRRVGRDGQVFDLLKFRSMRAPRPGERYAHVEGTAPGGIEGVDRRTPVGRFLRRSSLDELPQLINVVRGDMSLVGPRPERPEFVELFSRDIARYADRHRVRSGITGWAQVHGLRGQTSLSDRVEWDNFYIEHWSLALDAKILALTLIAVLRHAE